VVRLEQVHLAGAAGEVSTFLGGARPLPLLGHEVLEALFVHAHAGLHAISRVRSKGNPYVVVQLEGHFGGQVAAGAARTAQGLFKDAQALVQRAAESRLFLAGHLGDGARAVTRPGRHRPCAQRRGRTAW